MKIKPRGEMFDVWGQFYIVPTIKITYDKKLYGHYCLDVIWGKWGISISI